MLNVVLKDFIYFSLIESLIFCMYFKIVCNCNIKIKHILILGILNSFVSTMIPPILYQFVGTIYMALLIYYTSNNKLSKSIKYSFLCLLFIAFTEMICSLFVEIFFKIDIYTLNVYCRLIYFIFAKILEFILLLIYKRKKGNIMKWFIGEVVR